MGQKLSPPLLESTIPAFYSNDEGIVLTIPFSMNRAVGIAQVKSFQIKIKTMQSGTQLCSIRVLDDQVEGMINNGIISIIISDKEKIKLFRVGQFYKIQIAYIDHDDIVGFYSTVAVCKYTTWPSISINNLKVNTLNSHLYTYEGIYSQENQDSSERVYSYRFDLFNSEGELINTSGELLHNSSHDENLYESHDSYTFLQELTTNKLFGIKYTVITTNGLIASSPMYRISQKKSINPELNATLNAKLNYENGYINLSLESILIENEVAKLASGSFIIARACEDTNYTVWEEIHRFTLNSQIPTLQICKDFTVEQGKKYTYSLQQYNDKGLHSNRLLSQTVYVDFEDVFLFDGKRQLKIKYNPKIALFKKDLLETKINTIGSKYPFIFRNGRVNYSEFSISGLISYQSDNENLFLSKEELIIQDKTTNLTGDNIAYERVFKMKVLEWLTNGEPKIFRSPTEGNFIVSLMNVSLTPNDTLGRMLHSFNCTAYEVADFNYSNLGSMNFISLKEEINKSLQWETVQFFTKQNDGSIKYKVNEQLNRYPAKTLHISDMMPGDIVIIQFKNSVPQEIRIGVTGNYYIDTGVDIESVMVKNPSNGSMTYSYYYNKPNIFQTINDVEILEIVGQQFIGENDILKEITHVYDKINNQWIKNPKLEVLEMYYINIEKRPIQRVYRTQDETIEEIKNRLVEPFYIYEIGFLRTPNDFVFEEYYDSYNNVSFMEYSALAQINDEIIGVNEIESSIYFSIDKLTQLKSSNGVIVSLAYQLSSAIYSLEDREEVGNDHYLYELQQAKKEYENAKFILEDYLLNEKKYPIFDSNIEDKYKQNVKDLYSMYIIALVNAYAEAVDRGEIK